MINLEKPIFENREHGPGGGIPSAKEPMGKIRPVAALLPMWNLEAFARYISTPETKENKAPT